MKDERMTWKIREAEHTQAVAELTQKISRLETKVTKHEKVVSARLPGRFTLVGNFILTKRKVRPAVPKTKGLF